MYCLVPAQYKVVHIEGGTWPVGGTGSLAWVHGSTVAIMMNGIWRYTDDGGTRPYKNSLNGTGWYVLACTDPYDSIWVLVCCPAAGFAAAAILPGRS